MEVLTKENGMTSECGSHCGIQKVGKVTQVGHCPCITCHNTIDPFEDVLMGATVDEDKIRKHVGLPPRKEAG